MAPSGGSRKGAGRKAGAGPLGYKRNRSISIGDELWAAIVEEAGDKGNTISALVSDTLAKSMRRKGRLKKHG